MSKTIIDGKEHILLPVSVIDVAGQKITEAFQLSKRHLDFVKAQSFVLLWVKRGVFKVTNKDNQELPAYALTKEEYLFFTKLYNEANVPF